MANEYLLEMLKKGPKFWNAWRNKITSGTFFGPLFGPGQFGPGPDLSGADLRGIDLRGANLSFADFAKADLRYANLTKANLHGAGFDYANLEFSSLRLANLYGTSFRLTDLELADMSGANLVEANLWNADLTGANLSKADLRLANFTRANLIGANLRKACLQSTDLTGTDLTEADLTGADLSNSELIGSIFIETILTNASIENSRIYGVSAWNNNVKGLKQKNLVITREKEPVVTVDNIEVAQFIYLMLNNKNIRDVIGTIAKKGVLILGRFTPDRKAILDAIRDKLRENDFVPIMFDFEKVASRDFTETIKILAGLSRFVIADITNPKSAPMELQAIVPDYKIPFLPIIQKGETPFSMFVDLQQKYNWVLSTMQYSSDSELLKGFKKGIIERALEVDKRLYDEKQGPPPDMEDIGDFID